MKSILNKLLVAACALYLSGAHLALLQVAAWTTMLVERTEEIGFAEAAKSTFSGEAPCSMCRAVQKEENEKRKEASGAPSLKKLIETSIIASGESTLPAVATSGEVIWLSFAESPARRTEAPLTPPPLFA